MLSFSFWTVFSSVASMLLTQGLSIMYNIFYGVVVSAAIGIGNQVLMSVRRFTGNLAISFAPQIVKRYSSGEYDKVALIWSIGSKCTVWLFALFTFPIILNTDLILCLWLKCVPEHTAVFVSLFLIENLIRCFTGNTTAIVRATGRIRNFELVTNAIRLFFFILVALSFLLTRSITFPLSLYILNTVVQVFYNVYIGCSCIGYSIKQYLLNNCLLLFVILVIAYYILKFLISPASSFGSLLFNSFLDVSLLSILFYLVAFQPKERFFLIQVVKGLISNKTNKS